MKYLFGFIVVMGLCVSSHAQPNPISATIPGDTSLIPLTMAFYSTEQFTNIVAPNTNATAGCLWGTNSVGTGPYRTDVFIINSNLLAGSILADQCSLDGSNWCTVANFTVGTVANGQTPLMFSNIYIGKWDYQRVTFQGTNVQGTFENEIGR